VRYVIDAGVVVKWFIPEVDSSLAGRLLYRYHEGLDTPIAPDLLIPECANVFCRRCRQGDITQQEATDSLADLLDLNLPLVPATDIVKPALQLAMHYQRTLYDALYLALAQERSYDLVTADERFCNAVNSAFPQIKLLRHWQIPSP
jgi:predicted nucleic acid-binding protein